MRAIKTNEKINLWMFRTNITGKDIADKLGITRQAWSNKMKNNTFTPIDIITIQKMGYKE